MDKSELLKLINKITLTKKEKKVAEFFLEENKRVFLMTVSEIAKDIGVSDSTVIRFIKSIGFENFTAFKNNGQKKIKTHLEKTRDFVKNIDVLKENSIESLYINRINEEVNKIFNLESLKRLKEIANIIKNRNNKYIVGFKSTAGIANFFGVRLGFILENVWTFNVDDSVVINSLKNIKEEDVLVIFDYPMYSKTAEVLTKMAREENTTIIVFSDSETSPLSEYATVLYKVKLNGLSLFNSLIASQIIVEYILIYLTRYVDEKTKKRFLEIRKCLIEKL